jgi:hypothetical protein
LCVRFGRFASLSPVGRYKSEPMRVLLKPSLFLCPLRLYHPTCQGLAGNAGGILREEPKSRAGDLFG